MNKLIGLVKEDRKDNKDWDNDCLVEKKKVVAGE